MSNPRRAPRASRKSGRRNRPKIRKPAARSGNFRKSPGIDREDPSGTGNFLNFRIASRASGFSGIPRRGMPGFREARGAFLKFRKLGELREFRNRAARFLEIRDGVPEIQGARVASRGECRKRATRERNSGRFMANPDNPQDSTTPSRHTMRVLGRRSVILRNKKTPTLHIGR